jgi:hypothetical protein
MRKAMPIDRVGIPPELLGKPVKADITCDFTLMIRGEKTASNVWVADLCMIVAGRKCQVFKHRYGTFATAIERIQAKHRRGELFGLVK